MTRALVQIGVIASVLLALAGCGKKRAVERRDFEEVNEHVQKDMRGDGVSAEKRLDYVISKPDVWVCRRIEIARHWLTHHPWAEAK